MKENKEINQENTNETPENKNAEAVDNLAEIADKTSEKLSEEKDFADEELDKELKSLAKTFESELNKAIEEAGSTPDYYDEDGGIDEDDLCQCCGERRRDKSVRENYEYCSECREAMKHYPISAQSILLILVLTGLAIFSVIDFSGNFSGYYDVYKAEKSISETKISTGIAQYNTAIEFFKEKDIFSGKLYTDSAKQVYRTMLYGMSSMEDIAYRVEQGLRPWQANMPLYSDLIALRRQSLVLQETTKLFYDLIDSPKYKDYKPGNEETYKEIMTEIGSLIDKTVTIPGIHDQKAEKVKADKSIVRFCQYMFAYSAENYDDSYYYMKEIEKLRPEYTWLYAYELAFVETQRGNFSKAENLADRTLSLNIEAPDGYVIHSFASRMNGDYEEAVKWAEKGLEYNPNNTELIRFEAMAYCAQGNFLKAKEIVDTAYAENQYGMLCFTKIIIDNELGDKDSVSSLKNDLKGQNITMPERLQDYLDGRISAKDMFTKGTGDAQ